MVEASRLTAPTPLRETAWIARGACVIPDGTMSAVELSLTDVMDKIVVDDGGQCKDGTSTTDIALGHAMLENAGALGIGQRLRYA